MVVAITYLNLWIINSITLINGEKKYCLYLIFKRFLKTCPILTMTCLFKFSIALQQPNMQK